LFGLIANTWPRCRSLTLAAARLLTGHAPESVLNETTSNLTFIEAVDGGRLWVGLADDVPAGFAHVAMLADDLPHLEELDVEPSHRRARSRHRAGHV
jgi:hypothetical protein